MDDGTSGTGPKNPAGGAQRLKLEQLRAWESLGYGMFIHFGMSTYDGNELSPGDKPSTLYAPDKLDVDQWVQVARDAGMRYAVLTAKHVAGHCLWPTKQTDYHVGTSSNTTDVVEKFVEACGKHGLMAGLYYCSWDNHHRMGSDTPSHVHGRPAFTTQAYRDFQMRQIEELLTQYGSIGEVWIDIPGVLGPDGRIAQYEQIAKLQPAAVIMMNSGFGDGSQLKMDYAWPSDIMAIERWLPSSNRGYEPWFSVTLDKTMEYHGPGDFRNVPGAAKDFYIPGEVCDPLGYEWFFKDQDRPRSDAELLGMRLICEARGANLLLNVPPDRSGRIPAAYASALTRLRQNRARSVSEGFFGGGKTDSAMTPAMSF